MFSYEPKLRAKSWMKSHLVIPALMFDNLKVVIDDSDLVSVGKPAVRASQGHAGPEDQLQRLAGRGISQCGAH